MHYKLGNLRHRFAFSPVLLTLCLRTRLTDGSQYLLSKMRHMKI